MERWLEADDQAAVDREGGATGAETLIMGYLSVVGR
jgi:hypothetical protein